MIASELKKMNIQRLKHQKILVKSIIPYLQQTGILDELILFTERLKKTEVVMVEGFRRKNVEAIL
jgi:hypothetical protein